MYLIAVAVLAAFLLYKALRPFYLSLTGALPSGAWSMKLYLTARWWLLGIAILLPFALSLFDSVTFSNGQPVSFTRSITVPVLISSVVAVAVAGVVGLEMWRDYRLSRRVSFTNVGVHFIVVLAGVLAGIAGFKHVQFASGNAGVADLAAIGELKPVSDVHCAAGLVIVRWSTESATTPVHYRCPTGVVLGGYTQVPFVPWPDYHEGDSVQLAEAFAELSTKTGSALPADDTPL